MPQAMYAVTVHQPIDAVFAFIADGEKGPQWRPGITDITRVSGAGVGTRYAQGVSGPLGRRIAADYEITVFIPNRRLDFQTIAGPVRPHGRYDLEAIDSGTRLTFSLTARLGTLTKLLMGSAIQKKMDADVRNLDILKRILEIERS
jgi:carbon monoxide dehydrogenase subunit G